MTTKTADRPKTAKEEVKQLIENLPDDSTFDEIVHELAFERMIERGLADADSGRTLSNETMKQRIASWAAEEPGNLELVTRISPRSPRAADFRAGCP